MQKFEFVKVQGTGNDFIIVNDLQNEFGGVDLSALAARVCNRNFGIGADGLILVQPSNTADYRMKIINPDGSEAEMCGNGIRCFAKYLFNREMAGELMTVETLAGIRTIDVTIENNRAVGFTVNMGQPHLNAEDIPITGCHGKVISHPLDVDGTQFDVTCVSMGNPHCIIFTDSVDAVPLEQVGPKIETHPSFPRKTNVEFVQILNRDEVKLRVWERGAGITLACGTGACATVVAGVLNGKLNRQATVHLPGGDLKIEWSETDEIYMTGPAEEVFTGRFHI